MFSCQYIQKGVLFTRPPISIETLVCLLQRGLSYTLMHFLALAGRLTTHSTGFIHMTCNDAGIDFSSGASLSATTPEPRSVGSSSPTMASPVLGLPALAKKGLNASLMAMAHVVYSMDEKSSASNSSSCMGMSASLMVAARIGV
ncbi:hypothetical protein NE237_017511 [Protea cynaroides]|uniref:Uncharacterized protein n=1 Tax=Protea cynaroides TaxID=273540 RepID=A0A9Q0K872_9MAGN|nr:hypothetical protein NE237_017511 [Protea cynaroides]